MPRTRREPLGSIGIMGQERSALDEEALLDRLAAGDDGVLPIFYERYAGAAYTLALTLLRDSTEAQDVVQDVFLALWRRADSYDARRSSLRSWILAMVHHRAVDLLRSARHRYQAEDGEETLLLAHDPVHVEGEVIRRFESRQVRAALALLPPEQRRAVELAYFHGFSYPEIATLLDLPLGTVKSRLRLGLQKLGATAALRALRGAG